MVTKQTFQTALQAIRQRWRLALLIMAVFVAALFFLNKKLTPEPVPALQVKRENVVATLTVTGEVQTRINLDVSAPVNARIQEILVDEGDPVHTGQLLVVLEQDETLANLEEAQARLAQSQAALQNILQGTRPEEIQRLRANISEGRSLIDQAESSLESQLVTLADETRNVERLTRLQQQGAVSLRELETAQTRQNTVKVDAERLKANILAATARLRQTQSQLAQALRGATAPEIREAQAARNAAAGVLQEAQVQLANRSIRSDTDGVVTERLLDPGDVITPGKTILQVANRATLELKADLQEADLSKVRTGAKAMIVLDALPDKVLPGVVTQVGSEVNPDNGTVDVRVQMTDRSALPRNLQLLPGMTADVNIITDRLTQAMVVPAVAVTMEDGKPYVYLFKDGRIVPQPVVAKRISTENYQVLSGLKPGDWIARETKSSYLTGKSKRPESEPEVSGTGKP